MPHPDNDTRIEHLTPAEHIALDSLADLARAFIDIVGHGPTRHADLTEAYQHIHVLQNMLLAQAGARAYPGTYRLLGHTLTPYAAPAADA